MGSLRSLLIAAILVVFQFLPVIIAERNLSEITYHFTTCGKQGRYGPSYTECIMHYNNTDYGQPVSEHLTQQSGFEGGQQFVFPRSGWYEIQVAGASGGRGICNSLRGLGATFSIQVYIEKNVNDTYLILVGQQGTSPCDTNQSFSLCSNPPLNEDQAQSCYTTWSSLSYSNTGGGGGGGGSMLWPQNTTNSYSADVLPLIAAAGGAGTNAELDITILDPLYSTSTNLSDYIDWVNGQLVTEDQFNENRTGFIGNGQNNEITNGFGAGWIYPDSSFFVRLDKDGYLLSQSEDFGVGGANCSEANEIPFQMVNGGFGGGGGACSQGGGGGGYGGGFAVVNSNIFIGRGGYSLSSLASTQPFNKGDGYVRVFPLDCGCGSGQCNIFPDNSSFNCLCNGESTLHLNGFNCVRDTSIAVLGLPTSSETRDFNGRPYTVTLRSFNQSYLVYSAIVQFTVQSSNNARKKRATDDQPACIAVLVNSDGVPVIILSATGQNNYISSGINVLNGSNSFQNMSSLQNGQDMFGIVTMSEAGIEEECVVSSLTLTVDDNIEPSSGLLNVSLGDILDNSNNTFAVIASQFGPASTPTHSSILSSLSSAPTSTPMSQFIPSPTSTQFMSSPNPTSSSPPSAPSKSPLSTTVLIVVIIVCVLAVILLVVCIAAIFIVCSRKRKISKKTVYQIRNNSNISNGGHRSLTRRRTLQRLKTRIMSLTSNPNYGETTIGDDATDFIDLSVKSNTSDEDPAHKNLYESVSINPTGSLKRTSRVGSKKESMFRVRSKSRRRTLTLKPKYGIMAPSVNFYEYNSRRPEDDSWEYDRTQLTYMREIGEGQFGKVLLMKAKNIAGFNGKLPVAVKTLSSIDEEDIKKFMEEIELMKKFCHSNIVSLLGVNSLDSEGAPLLILEYMPYGDLQNFLKRHKPKGAESSFIGSYHHKKFARDVVLALNFLSENKYVHRDVAARNCLVGPNLEVKLADFGMARGVNEKDYYKIAGKAVLPVRWMAPESLLYGIFQSSSDVWSYGVLLWEIVTYGDMPLETLTPQEIVDMAQMQTLSHNMPLDVASEELMKIKDKCHIYEVEERIKFSEIIELLPPSAEGGTLPRNT